jgi:hypothetical protein
LAFPAATSAATLIVGTALNNVIIALLITAVLPIPSKNFNRLNTLVSCKKKDGGQVTAVLQRLGPNQTLIRFESGPASRDPFASYVVRFELSSNR